MLGFVSSDPARTPKPSIMLTWALYNNRSRNPHCKCNKRRNAVLSAANGLAEIHLSPDKRIIDNRTVDGYWTKNDMLSIMSRLASLPRPPTTADIVILDDVRHI